MRKRRLNNTLINNFFYSIFKKHILVVEALLLANSSNIHAYTHKEVHEISSIEFLYISHTFEGKYLGWPN
jgi:hypothetical protein